jgi:hypothetical protein
MQSDEYRNHTREEYKKRNSFTDSDYYKIVSFSMKLYKQCAETGKDVLGNALPQEEIKIAENLIVRMTREIALAEEQFNADKENSSNE